MPTQPRASTTNEHASGDLLFCRVPQSPFPFGGSGAKVTGSADSKPGLRIENSALPLLSASWGRLSCETLWPFHELERYHRRPAKTMSHLDTAELAHASNPAPDDHAGAVAHVGNASRGTCHRLQPRHS